MICPISALLTQPESHISPVPLRIFLELLATKTRYAVCFWAKTDASFAFNTQLNRGSLMSKPFGSTRYSTCRLTGVRFDCASAIPTIHNCRMRREKMNVLFFISYLLGTCVTLSILADAFLQKGFGFYHQATSM